MNNGVTVLGGFQVKCSFFFQVLIEFLQIVQSINRLLPAEQWSWQHRGGLSAATQMPAIKQGLSPACPSLHAAQPSRPDCESVIDALGLELSLARGGNRRAQEIAGLFSVSLFLLPVTYGCGKEMR